MLRSTQRSYPAEVPDRLTVFFEPFFGPKAHLEAGTMEWSLRNSRRVELMVLCQSLLAGLA